MFALPRASSLLAFGLSLFFTLSTASAVDLDPKTQLQVPGDFNGDGRMDALLQPLTVTEPGALMLRDGTGKLTVLAQEWDAGYLGLDWSTADSTLTAADLNGDGQDDVVLQPRKAGLTGATLITDPSIQLLHISQLLPAGYLGLDWSSAANLITPGDFDGDHRKELLLQSTKKGGPAEIVHADATGQLVAVVQQLPDGFLGRHWDAQDETIYVGDFNGDGRQDLLVQSHLKGQGESVYALLLADPDGQFTHIAETWNNKDLGADWNPVDHKIVLEDANHTGVMDIELMSTTGGENYLFEANAQGQFTQPTSHWTGDKPAPTETSTGTGKTGTSGGLISVIPSQGPTAKTITAPSNPEQGSTSPRGGSTAPGSGEIMTVNAAGRLEGSGGVSGGTATYSIPISVPPGIAGMQPSVSLSYSSRGGNGEMGMGWSLNAGSQIHRCPATLAMDGYSSGVNYSSNDRLCLDGQHLIYVSGGQGYGTNGAVYRTELDSFSQITESGNISSSTSSFTVVEKNGHTVGYGDNAGIDNVFVPAGAPAPLAWGIAIDLDTYNNSIIYTYGTFGSGEYLLTKIRYTGSGATAGNREVDFVYNTRSDASDQYLAGGLTQQTQLLSSISTQESGTPVLTYNIEYTSSAATYRSLLAGVQECAGSGTSQACLPETTFTWQQPAPQFNAPSAIDTDDTCAGQLPQPAATTISTVGDVNGDGYKDLLVTTACDAKVYLMGPGGVPQGGPIELQDTVPLGNEDVVDIDGDGTADIVGPMTVNSTTYIGYSRYDAASSAFTAGQLLKTQSGSAIPFWETYAGQTYSSIVAVVDVDGDGRPDIVVVMPDPNNSGNHMLAVYRNVTQPCFAVGCHPTPQFSDTPTMMFTVADQPNEPSPILTANSVGDMDGNGLPDFTVTYFTGDGVQHYYWVFTQNTGGTLSFPTLNQMTDGRDINAAWTPTMMDINGDGLPDAVYDCGGHNNQDLCYALNTGNDSGPLFGPEVDTGVQDWRVISTVTSANKMGGSITADIDNDGAKEILYPDTLLDEYCLKAVPLDGEDFDECVYSTAHTLPLSSDHSIYQFTEIKFLWGQLPNGSFGYVPSRIPTTIQAQVGEDGIEDLEGDGLTGVISSFTKGSVNAYFNPQGNYVGYTGLHVVSNASSSLTSENAAPDLMLTSEDGFGHTEGWNYYPISSSVSFNNVPLYNGLTAGGNSYVGGDYFYFSSSMYVVGQYMVDSGDGQDVNEHDFHYGQAIYNSQGRGFQGFRTVVEDDLASGARTVQVYHQRFPLSGTLQESWTQPKSVSFDLTNPLVDKTAIDHVLNTWGCIQGGQTAMVVQESTPITCDNQSANELTADTYVPVLEESVETHYDVDSNEMLSQTTTQYCQPTGLSCGSVGDSGYDSYGNSLGSLSVTTDAYGSYSSSVSNTFDTTDVADWWIDKLTGKVTNVQAAYAGQSPATLRTRTTNYDYYSASGGRGLNHSYAHGDGNSANEIDTQYVYSRGNVTSVTVSGGSGATAIAERTTTTAYTSDSYFVSSFTDPMGLATAYQDDPRFGEPTQITAPDQVVTTKSYDGFGRIASTQVGALPAQTTQYISHYGGDNMCDNTSVLSTYYALVNQTGYPSHYTCYDSLNRSIRDVTESFASESDLVYQGTIYDALGHVLQSAEPHFSSQPTLWNVNQYESGTNDILRRLVSRTDVKGVVTAYAYDTNPAENGGYQYISTQITTKTPNDPLDVSSDGINAPYQRDDVEAKNSLGKMMSVTNLVGDVDPNSGNPVPSSTTSYQYDSDGNPVTIVAADNTQITAQYDVLGHKTGVADPDQGTTSYTYDVLGDLLTQTDAKGQTLTMSYDSDGRMLTKTSSVGGEDPVAWSYDSCSAGKLCSVTQTNTGTGIVDYQEAYTYDSMGRVTTDAEAFGGTTYDTDTTYDADGRVNTVTYPDSIADQAPIASAGSTQYVVPGATVTLNGSGSNDPDGGPQPLAYQWAQTAGPAVTLSSATTVNPSFTAGASGTSYTFLLTADDGLLASTASVNIVVPAMPAAPATITDDGDTNHDGSYVVSWAGVSVSGAVITYSLEEATGTSSGPTGTWTQIYSGSALSTTVSHPGNSSYYYWYRVRAYETVNGTGVGYGPYSSNDDIHVVVTPGAPSSISPTLASTTTGDYTISWGAYTGSVTSADVFYELQMAENTSWTGATIVYTGTARSADFSAKALGDYYYRVEACNENGSVEVCSAWESRAHEIVDGTGGSGCPSCQPQVVIGGGGGIVGAPISGTNAGSSVAQPIINHEKDTASPASGSTATPTGTTAPASGTQAKPVKAKRPPRMALDEHHSTQTLLSAGEEPGVRGRPIFAPPVYKAWADAHLQNATGSSTVVRFAVQYVYTANGYLWQLSSPINGNRIYWKVNSFAGGSGATDADGNYYEHGMDARGNVTDSVYGAGGTNTSINTHVGYDPNSGYLLDINSTNASNGAVYQSLSYKWFAIGNLYSRAASPNVANPNTLSETFTYDLHNRLTGSTVTNAAGTQPTTSYQYDLVGDITQRTDVTGTTVYGYATSGAPQPHGVSTLTLSGSVTGSYGYDANGNMSCRDAASSSCTGAPAPDVTWNSDNLPTLITQGTASSAFSYAPDKHRYKQVETDSTGSTTTLYVGGMEQVTTSTGTAYYHYLTAYGRPVMEYVLQSGTSGNPEETTSYVLTDHLGSVVGKVDDASAALSEQSFASFGQRRDPGTWLLLSGTGGNGIDRHGFTGHEHLDSLNGLIHMNGRVYEPTIGRFLSVDPVFQAPTNSQSVNPYSYVMNNPLSLVDPSGYASAPACSNGSATACPNEITHGDPMTGTHIHGVNSGIKGADLTSLKSQQLTRLATAFVKLLKIADAMIKTAKGNDWSVTSDNDGNAVAATGKGNGQQNGEQSTSALKEGSAKEGTTLLSPRLTFDQAAKLAHDNNLSGQSDDLIVAMMWKESRFMPDARSADPNSTASGLMQVTKTADKDIVARKGSDYSWDKVSDPNNPGLNIRAGSFYLNLRIQWAGGDVTKGLEGYGTGKGYGDNILQGEKDLKLGPQNPQQALIDDIGN